MGFTKQTAEENRRIRAAALELYEGMDYLEAWDWFRTGAPLQKLVQMFPGIKPARLKKDAAAGYRSRHGK